MLFRHIPLIPENSNRLMAMYVIKNIIRYFKISCSKINLSSAFHFPPTFWSTCTYMMLVFLILSLLSYYLPTQLLIPTSCDPMGGECPPDTLSFPCPRAVSVTTQGTPSSCIELLFIPYEGSFASLCVLDLIFTLPNSGWKESWLAQVVHLHSAYYLEKVY